MRGSDDSTTTTKRTHRDQRPNLSVLERIFVVVDFGIIVVVDVCETDFRIGKLGSHEKVREEKTFKLEEKTNRKNKR